MPSRLLATALAFGALSGVSGCGVIWACKSPKVTAISLNQCDGDRFGKEVGIPFYLPKPLLIIAKNFRNIEEAKTGLTDSAPIPTAYDDQSKYADLNARTNFVGLNSPAAGGGTQADTPGTPTAGTAEKSAPHLFSPNGAPLTPREAPSDGLAPSTFYTYQIVFVPDMTQKYGLKIRGGAGEIRAAMNLVNGWQFTGIGPFYMKDSSTAQNILAQGISTRLGGQAAADVLNAAANLAKTAGRTQSAIPGDSNEVKELSRAIEQLPLEKHVMSIPNFAEICVYEPHVCPNGRMEWTPIAHLHFNREFLGQDKVTLKSMPIVPAPQTVPPPKTPTGTGGTTNAATVDPSVARSAVAAVFGLPTDSPALTTPPGTTQSAVPAAAVPGGGVNQIHVENNANNARPSREFNLFRWGSHHKAEAPRPRIQTRSFLGSLSDAVGGQTLGLANPGDSPRPTGGGTESAVPQPAASGVTPTTIYNQPTFNQPAITHPAGAPLGPVIPSPTVPPPKVPPK